MGGACHLAGVAVATPTLLLPHQHFTHLRLLATPKAHQIYTLNVFGHTNFENDSTPMVMMSSQESGAFFILTGTHPEGTIKIWI